MSATFKNMFVGTSVLALLVLASGVSAAPSLGINRPYYGSNNNRQSVRTFRSYAPAFSTETRQSFSYEPADKAVKVNGGCHGHVAAPQKANKAEAKQDTATAPKTTRRSYSLEPATPAASQPRTYNRGSGPKKDAWQYQKTDPRRYR